MPSERVTRVTAALPLRRLIGFSSLMFPIMAAQLPIAVYLPSLYAQYFGIPLGAVGTIFLVDR